MTEQTTSRDAETTLGAAAEAGREPVTSAGKRWDVIVVGARCAGATLAALLAREGKQVLLLEASPRGTDLPLSTHYLQPPAMDVLDRLGLGDRVRAVAPASKVLRAALDGEEVVARLPEGRYGYCIRRSTLDPWLQDAAESSGADFRDRHRVVDLVKSGDRVVGVVADAPGGRVTFLANLVVGADGPHSTIARLTGVEEYLVEEGSRGGYWGYFDAPAEWTEAWDGTIEHTGEELRYVFRSDGGQLVLVAVTSLEKAQAWGRDHRTELCRHLEGSPTTRALAAGKEPIGKDRGLLKAKYFYRRPIGPGFALAGDAGHFKDFVTGQGMTDAFLDAERLALSILDGREEAFEHYWRERDVATLPLHFDALRQGRVGYNTPFMRWVFHNMAKNPEVARRVGLVADRKLDPGEVLGFGELLRFVAGALVRGKFDVLPGFLAMGKATGEEKKELERRRALLREAKAKLERARARDRDGDRDGDRDRDRDRDPAGHGIAGKREREGLPPAPPEIVVA